MPWLAGTFPAGTAFWPSVTFLQRLTCEDAIRRLDDYADRSLPPEELSLVEAHLEECLHCARQFQFEEALIDGLKTRLRRLSIPRRLLRSIRLRLQAGTFP